LNPENDALSMIGEVARAPSIDTSTVVQLFQLEAADGHVTLSGYSALQELFSKKSAQINGSARELYELLLRLSLFEPVDGQELEDYVAHAKQENPAAAKEGVEGLLDLFGFALPQSVCARLRTEVGATDPLDPNARAFFGAPVGDFQSFIAYLKGGE